MRISLTWDEDRVQKLKKLWDEGYSASQCASRLGGDISRNAVIGKVNRLGLPARAPCRVATRKASIRTKHIPVPEPQPSAVRVNAFEFAVLGLEPRRSHSWSSQMRVGCPEPVPQPTEADIPRVSFTDLDEHKHCKWICTPTAVGPYEPQFCGGDRVDGLPYCECHARRAFQPVNGPSHSATVRYSTMAGGFFGVNVRKLEDA